MMKKNETFQQWLERISNREQNKIEGGCDTCNAYQTIKTNKNGIHQINIHHDDWCPTLQKINRGKN
jgi:hypothetical protein